MSELAASSDIVSSAFQSNNRVCSGSMMKRVQILRDAVVGRLRDEILRATPALDSFRLHSRDDASASASFHKLHKLHKVAVVLQGPLMSGSNGLANHRIRYDFISTDLNVPGSPHASGGSVSSPDSCSDMHQKTSFHTVPAFVSFASERIWIGLCRSRCYQSSDVRNVRSKLVISAPRFLSTVISLLLCTQDALMAPGHVPSRLLGETPKHLDVMGGV